VGRHISLTFISVSVGENETINEKYLVKSNRRPSIKTHKSLSPSCVIWELELLIMAQSLFLPFKKKAICRENKANLMESCSLLKQQEANSNPLPPSFHTCPLSHDMNVIFGLSLF